MQEFLNSLVPKGDRLFGGVTLVAAPPPLPPLGEDCWDKKDLLRKKCWTMPGVPRMALASN